jgi:hypothetical protein
VEKPVKSGWLLPFDQDPTPRAITVADLPEDVAKLYASSKPLRRRGPCLPVEPEVDRKPDGN